MDIQSNTIKYLIYQFLLFCTLPVVAQNSDAPGSSRPPAVKVTFYYNLNWELTKPEQSFFKREAFFDLTDLQFDGIYKDYNKDNILVAEGSYLKGVKGGLQNEYFKNRLLKSTIEYDAHGFIVWEFRTENKIDSVQRGTGKFSTYYFYLSGLMSQPIWKQGILNAEFNFGKRAGTWAYHDLDKKMTDEEIYQNGKLIKRKHYSGSTTIELDYQKDIIISPNSLLTESLAFDHTYYSSLNQYFEEHILYPRAFVRSVAYPGGVKRLLLLLARQAEVPRGVVSIAKLRTDEHGKITKYGVSTSGGRENDERVLKTIKIHEANLLPAIKDGKPYSTTLYLPVSGGGQWIDLIIKTPVEEILMMR